MSTDGSADGACDDLRSILRSIEFLAARFAAEQQSAAGEHGLTAQMAEMLTQLAHRGQSRMSDLSRVLECDTGNCSGVADRLEEAALVVRSTHPTDRRVRLASLTPAGRRLATKLERSLDASAFIAALRRLEPADRAALRRGLSALIASARTAAP